MQQSWSLPSTVKYVKPEQVSTQQWKLVLAEAWDKRQKPIPRSADTEEQYWWLCSELEAIFRDALRTLQESQPSVANKRPKGTAAGLQPRQWSYGAHRGGEGQHQERKLRIAAGRLRALLRIPSHHEECRSKILQRLSRAIGFDPRTDSIPVDLRRVEEQLARLLSEQSKKRIRDWRSRMKTSNVYKWVRQGLCCVPNSVLLVGEPGTASTTVNEALYNLVQPWHRVWDRNPVDWQDLQDAFRFPTASAQMWKSPSITELVASVQAQAGRAAGLDGWSGDPITTFLPKFLLMIGFCLVTTTLHSCTPFTLPNSGIVNFSFGHKPKRLPLVTTDRKMTCGGLMPHTSSAKSLLFTSAYLCLCVAFQLLSSIRLSSTNSLQLL